MTDPIQIDPDLDEQLRRLQPILDNPSAHVGPQAGPPPSPAAPTPGNVQIGTRPGRIAEGIPIEGFEAQSARTAEGGLSGLWQNAKADGGDMWEGYKALVGYVGNQGPGALVEIARQFPAAFAQSYTRWYDAAQQGKFKQMAYENPVQFMQDFALPLTFAFSGGATAAAKATGVGSNLTKAMRALSRTADVIETISDPIGGAAMVAARKGAGAILRAGMDAVPVPKKQAMPIDMGSDVVPTSPMEAGGKWLDRAAAAITDENRPLRVQARKMQKLKDAALREEGGTPDRAFTDSPVENRARTLAGLDEKSAAMEDRGWQNPRNPTKKITRDLSSPGHTAPDMTGGRTQLMRELGTDNIAEFRDYVAARRIALDLSRQGDKGKGFDIKEAWRIVERHDPLHNKGTPNPDYNPLIHETWAKFRQVNTDRLTYMEESGLLSHHTLVQMQLDNPNYTSFQRTNKVRIPVDPGLGIADNFVEVLVDEADRIQSVTAGSTGRALVRPPKSVIKDMKGSLRMLNDPFMSELVMDHRVVKEAEFNMLMQGVSKWADVEGSGVRWVDDTTVSKIPSMDEITATMDGSLTRKALETGENPLHASNTPLTRPQGLSDNQAAVFFDGERRVLEFEDPDLAQVLGSQRYNPQAPTDKWFNSSILGPLRFAAQTKRAGITAAPSFMLGLNLARDQWNAMWTSRYNMVPVASTIRSVMDWGGRQEAYDLWARSGGMQAHLAALDKDVMGRRMLEYMKPQNRSALAKVADKVRHPIQILQALREASETVTRLTEFHKGLSKELGWKRPIAGQGGETLQTALDRAAAQGMDVEAIMRSIAVSSRDVGTDFAMRPGAGAIRAWAGIVPFFNAQNQGMRLMADRIISGTTEQQAKMVMKTALGFTIPAMAITVANWNDEEIADMPSIERDLFVPIRLSNLGVPEEWGPIATTLWRYPVPFETGFLGYTLPARGLESMMAEFPEMTDRLRGSFGLEPTNPNAGGDPEALQKTLGRQIGGNSIFLPGFVPAAIEPLAEIALNKSFFYNADLEPPSARRLEKRFRTLPSTSEFARSMANAMHWAGGPAMSPIQVDQLITGYTGTIGREAVRGVDDVIRAVQDNPVDPPSRPGTQTSIPIVGSIVDRFRGNINQRSQAKTEFFDELVEIERKWNSAHMLDFRGDRSAYLRDNRKAAEVKAFRNIAKTVFQVSKAQQHIRIGKDSGPEKRKKIDAMERQLTTMLRKFMRNRRAQQVQE